MMGEFHQLLENKLREAELAESNSRRSSSTDDRNSAVRKVSNLEDRATRKSNRKLEVKLRRLDDTSSASTSSNYNKDAAVNFEDTGTRDNHRKLLENELREAELTDINSCPTCSYHKRKSAENRVPSLEDTETTKNDRKLLENKFREARIADNNSCSTSAYDDKNSAVREFSSLEDTATTTKHQIKPQSVTGGRSKSKARKPSKQQTTTAAHEEKNSLHQEEEPDVSVNVPARSSHSISEKLSFNRIPCFRPQFAQSNQFRKAIFVKKPLFPISSPPPPPVQLSDLIYPRSVEEAKYFLVALSQPVSPLSRSRQPLDRPIPCSIQGARYLLVSLSQSLTSRPPLSVQSIHPVPNSVEEAKYLLVSLLRPTSSGPPIPVRQPEYPVPESAKEAQHIILSLSQSELSELPFHVQSPPPVFDLKDKGESLVLWIKGAVDFLYEYHVPPKSSHSRSHSASRLTSSSVQSPQLGSNLRRKCRSLSPLTNRSDILECEPGVPVRTSHFRSRSMSPTASSSNHPPYLVSKLADGDESMLQQINESATSVNNYHISNQTSSSILRMASHVSPSDKLPHLVSESAYEAKSLLQQTNVLDASVNDYHVSIPISSSHADPPYHIDPSDQSPDMVLESVDETNSLLHQIEVPDAPVYDYAASQSSVLLPHIIFHASSANQSANLVSKYVDESNIMHHIDTSDPSVYHYYVSTQAPSSLSHSTSTHSSPPNQSQYLISKSVDEAESLPQVYESDASVYGYFFPDQSSNLLSHSTSPHEPLLAQSPLQRSVEEGNLQRQITVYDNNVTDRSSCSSRSRSPYIPAPLQSSHSDLDTVEEAEGLQNQVNESGALVFEYYAPTPSSSSLSFSLVPHQPSPVKSQRLLTNTMNSTQIIESDRLLYDHPVLADSQRSHLHSKPACPPPPIKLPHAFPNPVEEVNIIKNLTDSSHTPIQEYPDPALPSSTVSHASTSNREPPPTRHPVPNYLNESGRLVPRVDELGEIVYEYYIPGLAAHFLQAAQSTQSASSSPSSQSSHSVQISLDRGKTLLPMTNVAYGTDTSSASFSQTTSTIPPHHSKSPYSVQSLIGRKRLSRRSNSQINGSSASRYDCHVPEPTVSQTRSHYGAPPMKSTHSVIKSVNEALRCGRRESSRNNQSAPITYRRYDPSSSSTSISPSVPQYGQYSIRSHQAQSSVTKAKHLSKEDNTWRNVPRAPVSKTHSTSSHPHNPFKLPYPVANSVKRSKRISRRSSPQIYESGASIYDYNVPSRSSSSLPRPPPAETPEPFHVEKAYSMQRLPRIDESGALVYDYVPARSPSSISYSASPTPSPSPPIQPQSTFSYDGNRAKRFSSRGIPQNSKSDTLVYDYYRPIRPPSSLSYSTSPYPSTAESPNSVQSSVDGASVYVAQETCLDLSSTSSRSYENPPRPIQSFQPQSTSIQPKVISPASHDQNTVLQSYHMQSRPVAPIIHRSGGSIAASRYFSDTNHPVRSSQSSSDSSSTSVFQQEQSNQQISLNYWCKYLLSQVASDVTDTE